MIVCEQGLCAHKRHLGTNSFKGTDQISLNPNPIQVYSVQSLVSRKNDSNDKTTCVLSGKCVLVDDEYQDRKRLQNGVTWYGAWIYLQRAGTSSYGQEAMHRCTTVNYKTFAAG